MTRRARSIPILRLFAMVFVFASMAGASLGHVEVMRDCEACPLRAATTLDVSNDRTHDCCSQAAGDEKPDPARQEGQPGRCPVTCASCCLIQGRTIAAEVLVVPIDLAAAVGVEPAVPPSLLLPAGVGRSVFHPPRA